MQFRQNSGRDDRRRRVLIDESNEGSSKSSRRKKKGEGSPKGYTKEARDHQARITDLIPKRHRVIGLVVFVGILIVAAFNAAHAQVANLSAAFPKSDFTAIDLAARSNMMAWFSSVLLFLGAFVSLQIYSLRRYKEDDYRGTYRVWLWAAAFFVVASFDAATQFHHAVGGLLMHVAGTPLFRDGSIWGAIACAALFGSLGLRLLIEMRRCKSAIAISMLAGFAFAVTTIFQLDIIAMSNPTTSMMVHATAIVSAHALAVLAVWYYARYVRLEAHGQLKWQLTASGKSAKKQTPVTGDIRAKEKTETAAKPKLLDQASINELEELEDSFDDAPRTRKRRKQRQARANANVISMESESLEEDEQPHWQSKSKRRKSKNRRRAA